jgi:hypothetical protein
VSSWEQAILDQWRDLHDPRQPTYFYFVDPMPPGQGTGDAGHVLFVQQPILSYAAILLSTLFPGDVRADSQHVAVYIANRLSADSAIGVLCSLLGCKIDM